MNVWQIREDVFNPEKLLTQETVYTIGNGYFGTRGAFEENYPGSTPATLIEGVFDAIAIGKEELANVPDWLPIELLVNGERFRLNRGKLLAYERTLNMQTGELRRTIRWESLGGGRLQIVSERFASLDDPHLGVIRFSVTLEEQPGQKPVDLQIWSSLNIAVGNYALLHWEALDEGHEGKIVWFQTQTIKTHVELVQTMSFQVTTHEFEHDIFDSLGAPAIRHTGQLAPGETFSAEKLVTMHTSRDADNPRVTALAHHHDVLYGSQTATPGRPEARYDSLLAATGTAWQRYWDLADILIEGDEIAQRAVRYSIYQLRVSVPAYDSRYSLAAKGLTGFGYRGHVFHDTEIFMLPFFTYTAPDIARDLLLYRYRLLPAAFAKARANGYEGAQYPWESTLDGTETTPDAIIHPESGEIIPVLNGSIELHITSSIAFAFWNHWQVTGDDAFMRDYGAELLLSTAMFWASRAEHNQARGDYEISGVIGPDEWHEHVNNNAYTNTMARWNIESGLKILEWLQSDAPAKAQALSEQLDLSTTRLEHWRDVAKNMRVLYDANTGLIEQFDGFFQLDPLDQSQFAGRTQSYQALLGMQGVQVHRIVKQADVLMLLTVLRDYYDEHTKRANWDYYDPITDHAYGSSLTPALHAILACEVGEVERGHELFSMGALVDLENLRGNTPEGIHDACAGAVWQAVIFGFAGLRLNAKGYTLHPSWPGTWTRLAFTFQYKGQSINVDLRRDS